MHFFYRLVYCRCAKPVRTKVVFDHYMPDQKRKKEWYEYIAVKIFSRACTSAKLH